jgi:hypothetical protein
MHQRVHPDAARNRRATAVVGRFVKQFEGWHARSALIYAQLMAGRGERRQVLSDLNSLAAEVGVGYEEFKLAISDEPAHSRIDDIELSFQQLLNSLNSNSGRPF